MKKGMFIALMTLVAIVFFTAFVACQGKAGQTRSVMAKGHVPVICQEDSGLFSYYTPFQEYRKIYPISLMDSVRAAPRTPKAKVSFSTLSEDSFEVSVFAPVECLLKGMDSLYFIYPPDAKYSVRKDIFWTDKLVVALASKFWIVGVKNKIKHVYTPEAERLQDAEAEAVLKTAVTQLQAPDNQEKPSD